MDVIAMAGPMTRPNIQVKRMTYAERLRKRLAAINPRSFGAHMIKNELARLENLAPKQYNVKVNDAYRANLVAQRQKYSGTGLVAQLIDKELAMLQNNQFSGQVATPVSGIGRRKRRGRLKKLFKKVGGALKKITKGVKVVAMAAPRNAFLGLVKLNFRGLAYKLEKGIKRDSAKIKKFWERFGGKFSRLESAVKKGASKKPLLGSRTKRGGVGNIYDAQVTITGIGVEPATTTAGAALATAAPIIIALGPILKSLLTPKEQEEAEGATDPDTGEPQEKKGGKFLDMLSSVASAASDFASASGKPTTAAEPGETFEVADAEPGTPEDAGKPTIDGEIEDASTGDAARIEGARTDGGFTISPVMIGAAAVGLYLLTRKK